MSHSRHYGRARARGGAPGRYRTECCWLHVRDLRLGPVPWTPVRLGVLDVGSNTVHLLVVDAHRGAHPTPMHSEKSVLRLAEQITPGGELSKAGADDLVTAVESAKDAAARLGCEELMAFATSAVREAKNSAKVLARVADRTGVALQGLSAMDEARFPCLAVRRWYGWSAGQLLVLDIGGGSLEVASGIDENPDVAITLPLGAGRMTRRFLPAAREGGARPDLDALAKLEAHADKLIAPAAKKLRAAGTPDLVAGTSKTFRTLARLTGAAPYSAGLRMPRQLALESLEQLIGFVFRIESGALAELQGVSPDRAHQVPAGAVVAATAMRQLDVPCVRICPWALREGVILRRLDSMGGAE